MIDVDVKNQLVSRTAKLIIFVDKNPETNIKHISNELKIDYNFVSKIINRCEELGIMKSMMVGRQRKINIKIKGSKISNILQQLEKTL